MAHAVEALPASLSPLHLRPGNQHTIHLVWPADLAGRTFTVTLGTEAIDVAPDGTVLDILLTHELTAAMAAGTTKVLKLVETTDGDEQVLALTPVRFSNAASSDPATSNTFTVQLAETRVTWTLLGDRGPQGLPGADGLDGAPGADGQDGADGTDGLDGVAAATGLATYDIPTRTIDVPASAVQALITAAIDALIAGAPGALDTLNELAAAVNDDASFAASVTTALANKAAIDGANITPATWRTVLGLVIGTNVQAFAAYLSTLASVGSHAALVTALRAAGLDGAYSSLLHAAQHADGGADEISIDGSQITSGTVADARIAATIARDSEVTTAIANHAAALDPHGDRAYADTLIAANDAMVFKGVIDASGNPNYPAADRGHTYRISVAGKIGGAAGVNVEAGDLIICLTDGTAAGNQATVGASWSIVQTNLDGAVIGPAAATDGFAPLFDGATGKLLKNGFDPATKAPIADLPTVFVTKTTTYTAVAGEFVLADTSAGGWTLTLPAAPTVGQAVGIKKTTADANTLTVTPNVDGTALTLTTQYRTVVVVWDGAAWRASSGAPHHLSHELGGVDALTSFARTPNFQVFTSSGTWTKPAGAVAVDIFCIGAGGGGGTGRRGAAGSLRFGGGGGGGGGYTHIRHPASDLSATESVTVGAGGAGGAAPTADSTDGNAGSAGGTSSLGSGPFARAGGGGAGGGGTNAAAGAAGAAGNGAINGGVGGAGGASGGAAGGPTAATIGGGGGGGGGGVTAANADANGATGGSVRALAVGNLGGTPGAAPGGAGGVGGDNASANTAVGGGGGGGGAGNAGGGGGAGALGGRFGAGGGAAGAGTNGVTGGAGAAGKDGVVVVVTW